MKTTNFLRLGKANVRRTLMLSLSVLGMLATLLLVAPSARAQAHFTSCASNTGGNATVVVPLGSVQVGGFTPQTGDEIAVFRPDGTLCAGTAVYDASVNNAITVWGDNSVTADVIDGMVSDEVMKWVIWDASAGIEYPATAAYSDTAPFWPNGEYGPNRLHKLTTLTPIDAALVTVTGKVSLQGRDPAVTAVTIKLIDTEGVFLPITLEFDDILGAFSQDNVLVAPGAGTTYRIEAGHAEYLKNATTVLITTSPHALPATTLKGGDANNDGTINIQDLGCIGGSYLAGVATCGGMGSSDLTADGLTNIQDLAVAGGNYLATGFQPW